MIGLEDEVFSAEMNADNIIHNNDRKKANIESVKNVVNNVEVFTSSPPCLDRNGLMKSMKQKCSNEVEAKLEDQLVDDGIESLDTLITALDYNLSQSFSDKYSNENETMKLEQQVVGGKYVCCDGDFKENSGENKIDENN